MSSQEKLRIETNTFIAQSGVKAISICKKISIDPSYFCRFRKGKKYLDQNSFDALEKYLKRYKQLA